MEKIVRANMREEESFAVTPEKALTQALAKAAQDLLSLPLKVTGIQESRMTLSDLPEALEDRALLALLQGPKDAMGLLMVPPAVLASLIEMRTMGRLSTAAPAPRRPTRTDAAMAIDYIDSVLRGFEEGLAGNQALIWAAGFRYGSYLDDPRPLPLVLEDQPYRVFRMEVSLGPPGGQRTGGLLLALPSDGRGAELVANLPVPPPPPTAEAQAAAAAEWRDALEEAVMSACISLDAVVARVTISLGELLALEVGSEIALPDADLTSIFIEGLDGFPVARARLGQHRGRRAIRINDPNETTQPAYRPGEQTYWPGAFPQDEDGAEEALNGPLPDPALDLAGISPMAGPRDWAEAMGGDDPSEAEAGDAPADLPDPLSRLGGG